MRPWSAAIFELSGSNAVANVVPEAQHEQLLEEGREHAHHILVLLTSAVAENGVAVPALYNSKIEDLVLDTVICERNVYCQNLAVSA